MNAKQKAIIVARRERAKAWNLAHPERVKESAARWRGRNRAKLRDIARKRNALDPLPNRQRVAAFVAARPWYWTWTGARQRCTNPKHPSYHRYGGRGILFQLSEDETRALWERDGAATMERPSIDRIDNDGNYTSENCRFIELVDNSRKGSKNIL